MDAAGDILGRAHVSLTQQHPQPGWVEQDPLVIRDSVISAIGQSLKPLDSKSVLGIGLSTQRESVMIWDRATGQPLGPILGWQDRRTAQRAKELITDGTGPMVQQAS